MKKDLRQSTYMFSGNSIFIEQLYEKYLQNPTSVDQEWQDFFKNIGDNLSSLNADYRGADWNKVELSVIGAEAESSPAAPSNANKQPAANNDALLQVMLTAAYRHYGHFLANIDPLNLKPSQSNPALDIDNYNFTDKVAAKNLISRLQKIYCSHTGYEFEYISNEEEKAWFRENVENRNLTFSNEEKLEILTSLIKTTSFEQFLHKRFPGAKRFSVEGGDSLIPALEEIIKTSVAEGIENVEIGMAHRGRLNVLVNILEKPLAQMLAEFKGASSFPAGLDEVSGDVKYHMGYSLDKEINGKKTHISLAFNPSHLEAVNSITAGKVRAKRDLQSDKSTFKSMGILIHGDAAFMGQGSVAECLNMAGVGAYDIEGIVHIIVNNQIGFTANNNDSRATLYASDLAKFIEAPIIHVNGNEPEAVVAAARLASEFKNKFKRDVVIDINCYRRYGHNEGDEPNYTQPIMYSLIKAIPSLEKLYAEKLTSENSIEDAQLSKIIDDRQVELNAAFDASEKHSIKEADAFAGTWKSLTRNKVENSPATGVDIEILKKLGEKILTIKDGFAANPKLAKQLELKKEIVSQGEVFDWSIGESLAFATLLAEGYPVRLTGQDAKRGTFSHRHSVLRDSKTEEEYSPLNHLDSKQAQYEVADSVLSEFAVLGYEYGYSLANPNALTIWEAQFGDFANGAQVVFDQFIASSETKWLRMSGLVMLLPHGYEGQGPEHSSARLERYLQSCAQDNIQVANCTTPANFFHILRRQLHRNYRKPLVIMSPKSLLRHKLAVSSLEDFTKNTAFKPVISEHKKLSKVKKIVFCSGKIYYDLLEARDEKKVTDVALIRIEQLYPFPAKEVKSELAKHQDAEIIWCQEESENMGAWNFIDRRLEAAMIDAKCKNTRPQYIGRTASASPATGYMSVHLKEQNAITEKALK
jgi:2-oxoglutarate dehydrogenase E1 component